MNSMWEGKGRMSDLRRAMATNKAHRTQGQAEPENMGEEKRVPDLSISSETAAIMILLDRIEERQKAHTDLKASADKYESIIKEAELVRNKAEKIRNEADQLLSSYIDKLKRELRDRLANPKPLMRRQDAPNQEAPEAPKQERSSANVVAKEPSKLNFNFQYKEKSEKQTIEDHVELPAVVKSKVDQEINLNFQYQEKSEKQTIEDHEELPAVVKSKVDQEINLNFQYQEKSEKQTIEDHAELPAVVKSKVDQQMPGFLQQVQDERIGDHEDKLLSGGLSGTISSGSIHMSRLGSLGLRLKPMCTSILQGTLQNRQHKLRKDVSEKKKRSNELKVVHQIKLDEKSSISAQPLDAVINLSCGIQELEQRPKARQDARQAKSCKEQEQKLSRKPMPRLKLGLQQNQLSYGNIICTWTLTRTLKSRRDKLVMHLLLAILRSKKLKMLQHMKRFLDSNTSYKGRDFDVLALRQIELQPSQVHSQGKRNKLQLKPVALTLNTGLASYCNGNRYSREQRKIFKQCLRFKDKLRMVERQVRQLQRNKTHDATNVMQCVENKNDDNNDKDHTEQDTPVEPDCNGNKAELKDSEVPLVQMPPSVLAESLAPMKRESNKFLVVDTRGAKREMQLELTCKRLMSSCFGSRRPGPGPKDLSR